MLTTRTQTLQNVLPLLAPPIPTQPSMLESQKQVTFVTRQSPFLDTVKSAPYSESDYRWLAYVLELLIDIGNRDEDLSFNTVLRCDYRKLSPLLDAAGGVG